MSTRSPGFSPNVPAWPRRGSKAAREAVAHRCTWWRIGRVTSRADRRSWACSSRRVRIPAPRPIPARRPRRRCTGRPVATTSRWRRHSSTVVPTSRRRERRSPVVPHWTAPWATAAGTSPASWWPGARGSTGCGTRRRWA
jgi:hypothetical protein